MTPPESNAVWSFFLKRLPWKCPFVMLALLLLPVIVVAGEPLRVVVISDLNSSYGSTRYEAPVDTAIASILELKPDLVISTGDMVAGQRRPHLSRKEIELMWQAFHTHVSEPLAGAGIPFSVTPGNHDGSAYQGFALERAIYAEQWMPRKPEVRFLDDAGYPYNYAFELGDILFISLDATVVGHLPPSQMDWLRGVFDKNGQDYLRRVVFSHVPLWPFAQGRERDFIGDHELQALLEAADVDLYLSGHHHSFYPGVMQGIAFVSQSCLGAGPRRLLGMKERSPRSFTLIEITDDDLNIAAIAAPRFESAIVWNTLPARIRSSAAELKRADLSDTGVGRLLLEPGGRVPQNEVVKWSESFSE